MQAKQPADSQQPVSIKTYADLENAYEAHLKSENKSEQESKNFRSNLNTWRNFFNIDKDAAIELHFGKKFPLSLEKFKKSQMENGAQASTVASKVSKLKKINDFLTKKSDLEGLPQDFADRLRYLIFKAGFKNLREFWQTCLDGKCTYGRIVRWCAGKNHPSLRTPGLVEEIEKLLKLEERTLTSLLKFTYSKKKIVYKDSVTTIRVRLLMSFAYRVWEKHLEDEFQELVKFKTESILPEGIERHSNGNWTSSEGRGVGSANFTRNSLQSFFGYLHLPEEASDRMFRGKGYPKDKLTLGLLADKHLVESYVTGFRKWRSFDKYNNGHLNFLTICNSLLRPETGYLYQNPDFALKIGMSGNKEEWQEKCIDTRNRLVKIYTIIEQARQSGSPEFQMGRDPREPIADILALPNPISVVTDMIGVMLKDVDLCPNGKKRAVLFRDILLIALLAANPLRISMFGIMRFDRNLVRKEDGSWWIHYKREDFKNRKSLPSDYAVLVAPELIPLIERYKKEFRPLLFGAEECDYVFLKQIDPRNAKRFGKKNLGYYHKPEAAVNNLYALNTIKLSERVEIRVREYLNVSRGFRGHAFRHIAATSIIKSNPETGFFLASKVLHDKLETVEDNYAHLRTHEFFEPYNRFLSGLFKKVISIDGGGISSSEHDGGGK